MTIWSYLYGLYLAIRASILHFVILFSHFFDSFNGSRYAPSGVLVGGTGQRLFDGISLKPRKLPENAHAVHKDGSPTRRVHAVLACAFWIASF
jgi:hypothetical protein